jgi:serine/threonine protein kinase/tetratricopeptide (TPR) repeat protein
VTGERKRLIDDIFLSAVDLPPDRRTDFLETACPDAEIAREVKSLLAYDQADAASIDHLVQLAAASLIAADPLIGTHLGPYRITEELGKGGMGTVFLAVRDDRAFEKKVAVKVVKRGMDSDAVLERFRHERRILANLDHRYIGRLMDAGTTPDGRPYFVMEYVEGEPITAYCARRKLDLDQTLELFRKVCDAVSFAHRNLVVHRDLKASNILVSGDGSPKLLDFGIAKLLDPQGQTEDTAPFSRMLTLDCASPEQIRGEAVTTSTDIYSLGILLFELLAGRPPWDLRSAGSSREAEQIICDGQAPKPSAISRLAAPSGNWHALTGDLDNIVLMAIHKEPAQRYRSVDEFSADLQRYQNGLPVLAREDSVLYRGLKFLRRHIVAASLAAVTVTALGAGIVYANIERRHAEVRLTQMLSMANQTLLDLQTQIEHQPGATESRLRIMQSTLAYLANLAKEAGNDQEVRTTLGTAYLRTGDVQGYPHAPNMGDTSGALASYAAAEKLFSPGDHLHLAQLFSHRGDVLCQLGRSTEGLSVLRQSLDHSAKSDSKEMLLIRAETYHRIAYALTQSNPDEALENSRNEMEIYTRLAQREPDNVEVLDGLVSSYSTTGGALNRRMRFDEALELYRKGLAIRERLVAKNPTDVALRRDLMISYGRVGDVLNNPARGKKVDQPAALENYRKALAIAESLAASDPKNRLARMDLAQIRVRLGAAMNSRPEARESLVLLDAARQAVQPLDPAIPLDKDQLRLEAWVDEDRGLRLAVLGDADASLAALRSSLEEAQLASGKDPQDFSARTQVLYSHRSLARQLAAMGRRDEALHVNRTASHLAAQFAVSGPDAPGLALFVPRSLMWLGETYETLAGQDRSPRQRKEDFAAAAESYAHAGDSWKAMRGRADFPRWESEMNQSAKKALECIHQSKQE